MASTAATAEGAQKVPSFLLKVNFTCCFSVVASSITEICIIVGVLGSRHHLNSIVGRTLVVVNCTYLPLKLRFSFQTKVVGSWSKSKNVIIILTLTFWPFHRQNTNVQSLTVFY